jgi:hypothetical protein
VLMSAGTVSIWSGIHWTSATCAGCVICGDLFSLFHRLHEQVVQRINLRTLNRQIDVTGPAFSSEETTESPNLLDSYWKIYTGSTLTDHSQSFL